MFWRDSALVATAFVFIFGWKVTAALDLILVASLMLSVWVFVLSDLRLAPAELRIAACLIALSAYSVAVAIAFGGVDVQTALRSLRAVINFLGAAALVRIYACLLYTSPSPRDRQKSRMPSSA